MRLQQPNGFLERTYVQEVPATLTLNTSNNYERTLEIEAEGGSVDVKFASFGQFSVFQISATIADRAQCTIREMGTTLGLYFHLSGTASFPLEGQLQTIGAGHQNLFYSSDNEECIEMRAESNQWRSLEIDIPVSYYTEMFGEYAEAQQKFLAKIREGKSRFFQTGVMPMTLPMKWIVNTIVQCTRTGVLKRLFYEARVLELLMLHTEQFAFVDGSTKPAYLFNVEAIREAQSILEKNVNHPPTIKTLSRMVGMNEFNLKKGFKTVFNSTIYQYVSGLKMQHARHLILEENMPIQEVAAVSGYKNPQHFTTAFKKYFGQLPSAIKSFFFVLATDVQEVVLVQEGVQFF